MLASGTVAHRLEPLAVAWFLKKKKKILDETEVSGDETLKRAADNG